MRYGILFLMIALLGGCESHLGVVITNSPSALGACTPPNPGPGCR